MTVAHTVSQAFVHGLGALACTPAAEVAIHAAQERERLERLERKLRERVWKTLLFAWRGAETRELARHAAFLESQPGRWFFAAVEDSLTATLEAATKGLDSRLAPAAADRCGASPAR